MRISYLITAIVVGLGVILALQYRNELFSWLGFSDPPPAIEPQITIQPSAAVAPAPQLVLPRSPEPQTETEPVPPLPELDASDDYVRELLESFSAPQTWIAQSDLARRLAVLLSSASAGSLPRSQLGFLAPEGAFVAQPVGDDNQAFLLDARTHERFAPAVDAMLSVPPSVMAVVFTAIEPLLGDAVAELGERREVRELLNEALQQVLSTPVLDRQVVLKRPGVVYEFADPELEALSDLQKQLLRMGPGALARIQEYAKATAQALNVGAATTPTPSDESTGAQP